MDPTAASTLNLLLRGATIGVLLLVALALWRERRTHVALRLGAAFAIGVAASTLAAMPGFTPSTDAWHAAVVAVAAGSMFVFWLFTRALLDDDFRPGGGHLVVWALLAGVGALHCLVVASRHTPASAVIGLFMGLMPVAWALLAIAQSLASWRVDLVERRRELRTLIIAATSIYTLAQLVAALTLRLDLKAVVESPHNAAGTAALTLLVAWRLLQARVGELFPAPPMPPTTPPVEPARPDARQLATLTRLMTGEHVYREPSLTIAALAQRMGLPEHRLRKLINQALGHRNFNAFLNAYRIEDAKGALHDPARVDVPVLTIAMDVGFQSIGPFNRAFKAATGTTPTEFRRGRPDPVPVDVGPALAETESA